MHVDKHCVKMILETAQLLSTAHRVLDGNQVIGKTATGRNVKRWILKTELNEQIYSATHINHPSAVWARKSKQNYVWLYRLFLELLYEYTYRYGKRHKCQDLEYPLSLLPENIPDIGFTEPTPAMPEQYKVPGNSVQSYKNYYNGEKQRMFSWKKRETPEWIQYA